MRVFSQFKTSAKDLRSRMLSVLTLVVVLADNSWLWAQPSLPRFQLFLPQTLEINGISEEFKTPIESLPGRADDVSVHFQTGPIQISKNTLLIEDVQFQLKASEWRLKHDLFELKCRNLVAKIQISLVSLILPENGTFRLSSRKGHFQVLDGEGLTYRIAHDFVEEFFSKLKVSILESNNFTLSGDCPGRSRSVLSSVLLAFLKGSDFEENEVLKKNVTEKIDGAVQEVLRNGIQSHALENLHKMLSLDALEIPLVVITDKNRIRLSTPKLAEETWVAQRLEQRNKRNFAEDFEVYIPTETLDFLSLALWRLTSKKLSPSDSVHFEADGSLAIKIAAGWKVERLKPFNPLFATWDDEICLDVEFVTKHHSVSQKSPSIRPFKSQGGFRSGIEFEIPLTVRYIDSKSGSVLGEQGIGELSLALGIERDFRNPQNYFKILNTEIVRNLNPQKSARKSTSDVPPGWVDTLEFLLNEHMRKKILTNRLNGAIQEIDHDQWDILERMDFLVIPNEKYKRAKQKSSYYAAGILVTL